MWKIAFSFENGARVHRHFNEALREMHLAAHPLQQEPSEQRRGQQKRRPALFTVIIIITRPVAICATGRPTVYRGHCAALI